MKPTSKVSNRDNHNISTALERSLINGWGLKLVYGTPTDSGSLVQSTIIIVYPRHLCRRVYSFRLSVRPFVCSLVRTSVTFVEFASKFCVKSFSSGVYLSNYSSESIHIWTIVTLEGWHSLHDHGPQGPCPGVGPEVKI